MSERFIKTQALYSIIDWEPFILLACLLAVTWLFYKFFLGEVSQERHASIRGHFQKLVRNFIVLTVLFIAYMFLHTSTGDFASFGRITPYVGLLAFIWGGIVFVKTCRLLVLQYLFLGSIRAGVPLLLVNIFSLLLSVILCVWGLSQIFGLDLGPLLATSAAFSIILGLALQDTLGNLFAGIALQIDKPYEIDDWLEIFNGSQKAVGKVQEITWRSTVLVGWSDEKIVIPNRVMAQAQVSNFSPEKIPVMFSQSFRIRYGSDIEKAVEVLTRSLVEISDIRPQPAPFAYVRESGESWILIRVLYWVDNYGAQYFVGDKVIRKGIETLRANGIELAKNVIEIQASANHELTDPRP